MREVERQVVRLRAELSLPDEPVKLSRLGEQAADWLRRKNDAKRPDGTARLAPTTRDHYKHAVEKWIVPLLGDYYLDRLTTRDIEDWRDYVGEKRSASTVNGLLNVLLMILRDAECNVGSRVAKLEADDTRITDDEPNALAEDEIERFLAAAKQHAPQHFALILMLMTTAARVGTVLALRWEDLDPEKGEVHFRRRLSKNEILPGVKRSRKSKDVAPLLPEVYEALKQHNEQLTDEQLQSGLVFPSTKAKTHWRTILKKVFVKLCKEAGIKKRFTPHGCRRTAAAVYRRIAGSVVSKAIAGHTTERMHAHYATASTEEKLSAAQKGFGARLRVISGGEAQGAEGGIAGGTGEKAGNSPVPSVRKV
jgi:integrase